MDYLTRGISPSLVTAVIVTSGTRDLAPVLASLSAFHSVVVYDNSKERVNYKVYGRYAAVLTRPTQPVIYTQDDDAITDAAAICAEYVPGILTCNMKQGHHDAYRLMNGIALVGHGAVFDKSMIDFSPYLSKFPPDDLFLRECDRVFTVLNRAHQKWTTFPITDLPGASEPGQAMWLEKRHGDDLVEIRRRLASL